MKPHYFTEKFLEDVRSNAKSKPEKYKGEAWVAELPGSGIGILPAGIDCDELPELTIGDGKPEYDGLNARILFSALRNLTPVQASDERFWACLTHTTYFSYVCKRWGSEKDTVISSRWFLVGSGMERLARNGLARLWWAGYATFDENSKFELTDILFKVQDTQNALMERLYSKNFLVLRTFLKFLRTFDVRIQRLQGIGYGEWIKSAAKKLNLQGGVLGLDFLNDVEIMTFLEIFLESFEKDA